MGRWEKPHLEETQEWRNGGESPEVTLYLHPARFLLYAVAHIGFLPGGEKLCISLTLEFSFPRQVSTRQVFILVPLTVFFP